MTKAKKTFCWTASVLAIAVAVPFVSARVVEKSIEADMRANGVSARRVDVSLAGAVVIRDVVFAKDGVSVSVGRLERHAGLLSLITGAAAQSGGYSFENLSGTMGPVRVDIPRIDIVGATVGKADLPGLFVMDAGLPARLKGLSATSMSIPEMRVGITVPNTTDSFGYVLRNIAADNVVNGKIARIVIGQTTFESKMKDGNQKGEILRTETTGVDLAHGARVYFATANPDEKALPLYTSYVGEGMRNSVASAAAVEMEIGRFSAGEMRAKPLKTKSLAAAVADIMLAAEQQKTGPTKTMNPEALGSMLSAMSEIMDSFEDEGLSIDNTRFFVGDKAKPMATFGIAKIEGSYGGGKVPAGFRLTGMQGTGPDLTMKLASASVEGFSYGPTLKGMADAIRAGDTNFKNVDPRTLMPRFGTSSLKGFELDMPDPKAPKGVKPERINVKLGQFVFAARDELRGVPTDINIGIDNLALKLPENSSDDAIKQLKALGYTAVDMSARVAAKWNEASRELAVSELSVGGVNMGKAKITAVLGNIGREIFEGDLSMAQVALMGATAKALNLQVENTGLAEKALAFQGRAQNRKPDDLRRELGTMAQLGIPAVLGPSDDAKAVANAVARFITQLKTLQIDVKSKNPGGVGIPDIATIGTPDKAMNLVNVQATAN